MARFCHCSDLGEGKIIEDRVVEIAGVSYGCEDYRAPEVRGRTGWSEKADIYSFGKVCCAVLRLRARVCSQPVPHHYQAIIDSSTDQSWMPESFASLVKSCLESHPALRPTAATATTILDRLSSAFPDPASKVTERPIESTSWKFWNFEHLCAESWVDAASGESYSFINSDE